MRKEHSTGCVSPYLMMTRRDLPTACRDAGLARGMPARLCQKCDLSDICRRAMRSEGQAISKLPQVALPASRAIVVKHR